MVDRDVYLIFPIAGIWRISPNFNLSCGMHYVGDLKHCVIAHDGSSMVENSMSKTTDIIILSTSRKSFMFEKERHMLTRLGLERRICFQICRRQVHLVDG